MNVTVISLNNYEIGNLIHQSDRTLVYRGLKKEDSQPVVIKLMRNNYPSFNELVQFRNQYTIAKHLDIEGIIKPHALERYENRYALIMEDFEGISLAEEIAKDKRRTPTIPQFLHIAIQLTEILHHLHQKRVIHKDIKPANILIHPETGQVKLIDFSISSLLPKETQTIQPPNVLEGTLAYLSPEQTGRMNRGIDYRSDFYSLGVTFYELLSGKRPFESKDPLELVHCHIAKIAEPFENERDIPNVLANIAMKLMAKNAENRYQSALGLKHDLEKCLSLWQETGKIESFALGERDRCDRFLIPEKLYGREQEVQTLLAAFDRVASGQTEMMLVAGFSGIGKTAVINEVHKPIVRQRGYFIKGKFDQFQRNIPFSAFVQAFRDLMGQLLGESDGQLQQWKSKILKALGENARVIIDVIPELEQIIGQQPPVAELSGNAARNRFNRLFEKFIQVFTTPNHPLVIFIDDLQWADSASLKLMQLLMGNSQMGYLLLLGAYRDNEVFPAHPLMLTLDKISQSEAALNTITLASLSKTDLNRLVADTLSCQSELAFPLTELVYQKTRGNPFFATQFLKGLHEDGWIAFNRDLGYWECDLTQIYQLALTDDVVEFMVTRLQKLSTEAQQILQLAACIGNQFDLTTLAMACEQPSSVAVATALWGALAEGLILPISETYKFFQEADPEEKTLVEDIWVGYKFLHDRVQQAAYSLIAEAEKEKTHLHIGRLLLNKTSESNRDAQIFAIVGQLNLGAALIEEPLEFENLARLNLIAARKAKASTAYQAASDHLKIALELLAENCWERQYELTRDLHQEAALVSYLMGDFEQSERYGQFVLERGKTMLEKIEIYYMKIQSEIVGQRLKAATELGLGILERLGIVLETEPPRLEQIEQLKNLPELTDPYKLAALKILDSMGVSLYNTDRALFKQVIYTTLNVSVQSGSSSYAAMSCLLYSYNSSLFSVEGDLEKCYRLGKMGMDLFMERFSLRAKEQISAILHVFNGFVRHWKEPLQNTLPTCLEAFQIGQENGEIIFSGYQIIIYLINLFFLGESLDSLAVKCEFYLEILEQQNLGFHVEFIQIYHQAVLNLLGRSEHSTQLIGTAFDETEKLPRLQENPVGLILFSLYALKGQLAYLFGELEDSINGTAEARQWQENATGFFFVPVNQFYSCLGLLKAYPNSDSRRQKEIISQVESYQKQMQDWASYAPSNFQHKYELIEAEKAKLLGQYWEAVELYDRAINGAKESNFLQEEALANELAAKFYLERSKEKLAFPYIRDAYYCYSRWGAKAKVEDIEKRYSTFLTPILQRQKLSLTPDATSANLSERTIASTTTNAGEILDLATLMKASRTLSEEIELEGAIANLMRVAKENAGAETIVLMLFQERVLMLTAKVSGEDAPELDPIPVETSNAVPLSIVNQVKRRQQPLLLENASQESSLAGDAYIQQYQPRSLLCLPLIDRGQLIGILYLENNQCTGAFTSDCVEILNLLCSQAAIALENARLYRQAQQALTDLQQAQLQLVQNEKMATLGNLVAGVAHEINNPVGFIGGNVGAAQGHLQGLLNALSVYRQHASIPESVAAELEDPDLDFIAEDFPQLIASMRLGVERLRQIGVSLRSFSRTDTEKKTEFNLHEGLESTLLILKYRLKANERRPAIEIIKEYGNLGEIQCYPGQLNQVFMNLLGNAIDALDESNAGLSYQEIEKKPNQIRLKTERQKDRTIVKISDNGTGMTEEVKARIFEQGFTTKAVGKGTGLGMAISKAIVEEKHGGAIACLSEPGNGTEFIVSLPLD